MYSNVNSGLLFLKTNNRKRPIINQKHKKRLISNQTITQKDRSAKSHDTTT